MENKISNEHFTNIVKQLVLSDLAVAGLLGFLRENKLEERATEYLGGFMKSVTNEQFQDLMTEAAISCMPKQAGE